VTQLATVRRIGFGKAALLAAIVGAGCLIARQGSALSQPTNATPRVLGWDPDQTIVSRLRPDDEAVSITRHLDILEPSSRWTWKQVVADAVARADLVILLDADEIDGVLAEQDTWINTRLRGVVRQVLKHSAIWNPVAGATLDAQISDGELMIGKVRVKASSATLVTRLTANRPYLLFLRAYNGILYPTHTPLFIEGGRLVYPWRNEIANQPMNPLEGHTLDEVEKQIR
jgi:hypothetical protein